MINADKNNIYKLDGYVPVGQAIPFGLQHVLAMFVANITPIIIIVGVATFNGIGFNSVDSARLIQSSMLIAGISTMIQLFPVWRIGAKLPVVMGVSFTFMGVLATLAAQDYSIMIGAVLVGGIFEGILGLTAKYWRKVISPVVSACVVTATGFSLLSTGISSFASSAKYDIGSWQNLLVGFITLFACIAFYALTSGIKKHLYVLFGLAVGYIASIFFDMVDFSSIGNIITQLGFISVPRLFAYTPKFNLTAIISVSLIYLVSAAETIGDTSVICSVGLGREVTEREISGSLACDGFLSAVSGAVFGCTPITSFSQNVGLLVMTKVVNRFTIMFGALTLVLSGLFPPIGAFLATLPDCVLGGCTIMMFGTIIVSGIRMLAKLGFNQRNTIIIAISFCVGIGATQVSGFFDHMPPIIGDVFSSNPVAGVFVISTILSLVLPKRLENDNDSDKIN